MIRKYNLSFFLVHYFVFERFFQTAISNPIERYQLKLSPKAKEAFEQINRTVQSRLEGDQTKVNFYLNKIFFLLKYFRLKMSNVVHKLLIISNRMRKNLDDVKKDKYDLVKLKIKFINFYILG